MTSFTNINFCVDISNKSISRIFGKILYYFKNDVIASYESNFFLLYIRLVAWKQDLRNKKFTTLLVEI